jgi:Concanavalin A-like lectin/glucanases superfamily
VRVNIKLPLPSAPQPLILAAALLLPHLMSGAEIWKFDNVNRIGGHPVVMLGEPKVAEENGVKGLVFDGAKDGIFIPSIPIAGATEFTVEVLFFPAEGGVPTARSGLVEERFFHVGDRKFSRMMFETRKNLKGVWWLDHFMVSSGTPSIVAIDPKLTHPTNQWYWVALRWDGTTMTSYINGIKEMEKKGKFGAFVEGQVSIGVRQTIEYWFKGGVREVRFHREAVSPDKLQRL